MIRSIVFVNSCTPTYIHGKLLQIYPTHVKGIYSFYIRFKDGISVVLATKGRQIYSNFRIGCSTNVGYNSPGYTLTHTHTQKKNQYRLLSKLVQGSCSLRKEAAL